MIRTVITSIRWTACASLCAWMIGCGKPNQANIDLRKQNQDLRQQLEQLRADREADAAHIRALEDQRGTVATLPGERLEQMFTVHRLKFGRLSGGADLDRDKPGDEALKLYLVPVDRAGDELKAAGSFTVQAFQLDSDQRPLVGTWQIPLEEAARHWYGEAMLYTYVLTLPWQEVVPGNAKLTVKATFHDALTQREIEAQQVVRINPPGVPSTFPATAP